VPLPRTVSVSTTPVWPLRSSVAPAMTEQPPTVLP
jgi:hypothetical protein